jgi:hypothetical protein
MMNKPSTCLLRAPLVALLASCLLFSACETMPVMRKAEDLVQVVMVKVRSKGEKRLADPAQVARDLSCGAPGAVPARFEASDVLPERPKPGSEVNHRLVVAACSLPGDAMAGTLTRRFTHLGRTLFQDSEPFTLKPGRWSIDVFIGIPAQAGPGPYRLEVRFERRGLQLDTSSEFTVLAP